MEVLQGSVAGKEDLAKEDIKEDMEVSKVVRKEGLVCLV